MIENRCVCCGATVPEGRLICYDCMKSKYDDWNLEKTSKLVDTDISKGVTIYVKYFNDTIDRIEKIDKGDWIDLRAAEAVSMCKGEFALIPLGVGMILPKGYEAHVVPRSSTFKNYGIIQTNHMGIIDESYCGDNDQWYFPAYAVRDTVIHKNDRICQFRIVSQQPAITFAEVMHLKEKDRGGFGSTGRR